MSSSNSALASPRDSETLSAIEWRITGKCTENCIYCYGPDKKAHPNDNELSRILTVISKSPVPVVRLSGGEPLLVPSIATVLASLKAAGKIVVLSTNGVRFVDLRSQIETSLDKLNLSMDGYDEATHAINGRKGFDVVIKVLEELKRCKPEYTVKVGTVLTARNLAVPGLLPRMHALLTQHPVDRWKIYQYVPEGPIVDEALCVDDDVFRFLKRRFLDSLGGARGRLEVVFASASDRDRAYFIVQPRGEVIIPVGDSRHVTERQLGNVLTNGITDLVGHWATTGLQQNHRRNVSVWRKAPALDIVDRLILFAVNGSPLLTPKELASRVNAELRKLPKRDAVAKVHAVTPDAVMRRVGTLFDTGVIRYTMPVVNLESLGFSVYLVDIEVFDVPAKAVLIERFKAHANVGWLVDTTEPGIVLAAIFARSGMECSKVLGELADPSGKAVAVSTVCEKFVLGQRYLGIDDIETQFMFDAASSRIAFEGRNPRTLLDDSERSVLGSLRELRATSLHLAAKQADVDPAKMQSVITDLTARSVIVKFQPVYDVRKLGCRWFLVALRTRLLEDSRRKALLAYLQGLTRVVHINCMLGNWDLNFEVHAKAEEDVVSILDGLERRVPGAVMKSAVREINEEYKFNFLTDCVLQRVAS